MEFHRSAGLPGGDETVAVLHLAMLGLILEHLMLPGVLDGVLPGVGVPEGLVERIVATVAPERWWSPRRGGGRPGQAGQPRGSRHIGHICGPFGRSRGRPVSSKPRRSYIPRLRALLASR